MPKTLKASGEFGLNTTVGGVITSTTLGAITFAPNSLVVVVLGEIKSDAAATGLSCSASGLTFTDNAHASQLLTSKADEAILTAPDVSGGSRAITITSGARKCAGLFYTVFEVTGHDTVSPIGATASQADNLTNGAKTMTLSASPAATSIVIAGVVADTDPGLNQIDPGSTFTEEVEIDSAGGTNYGVMEVQSRTGSTSTTVDWADVSAGASTPTYSTAGVAIEIKMAATTAELDGTVSRPGFITVPAFPAFMAPPRPPFSTDIPSGLTQVTATRATTWNVKARVTSTRATTWRVLSLNTPYIASVSTNGRYFRDQLGNPILVKGDSPWAILVNSSTSSMDHYLSVRASQGFNLVLVSLLGNASNGGPNNNGQTFDAVLPFVGGDPSVLNATYWDRVEHFLSEAEAQGITVVAYPLDGWAGTSTYSGLAAAWSTGTATAYGTAVAARLTSHPNVIYATGGDFPNTSGGTVDDRFWAVFTGLTAGGADRIKTIQFNRGDASLDSTFWDEKIQYNFVYPHTFTYAMLETAYGATNPNGDHIPALMGESYYENRTGVGITDDTIRVIAAWSLTSGSPGEIYGSEDIWDADPTDPNMVTTAVGELSALRAAFGSLAQWHELVPDYSSTFITAGRGSKGVDATTYGGTGTTYVTGGVTPDGHLGVIFIPNAASTITIDQSKMGSGYTARWVDPTTGSSTGTTTGATYTHAGANAAGGSDWLLILESTLTQVTATRATTWRVRAQVTATRAATWKVRSATTATRATTWDVLAAVTSSRATTWRVRAAVTATRATTWDVLTPATATRATTWRVLAQATTTRATTWNVASSLLQVTSTRATTWRVIAQTTSSRATTWNVRARVTSSRATTWDVLTPATSSRATTWRVRAAATATRATTWRVRAYVTSTRATTWNVDSIVDPGLADTNPITLTVRDVGHAATVSALDAKATVRALPAQTTVRPTSTS